jgi:hydroxysqualene dehydroxylase
MSAQQPRFGVVGAGLAGLSAAVSLKNRGAHVTVHERTRLLGGKATSYEVDGVEVDNGQHVVLACCTSFLDFAEELGSASWLHMQPAFDVVVLARDGRRSRLRATRLPAPLHLLPSFAAYGHLSWLDKLRVAGALVAAMRERSAPGDMASWLRRHGQTHATRVGFWDPFLVPALNAALDRCSADAGLFVIRTAFLSAPGAARIGYSTVPLERIARRAAARADSLLVRSGIASVDAEQTGVTLRTDQGLEFRYDGVVLAVPPRRLAAMLGDQRRFGISGLDAFRTEPIVDVHLWYQTGGRRLLGSAGFAALLDSPVQWVFEKAPGYLCCSLSAAQDWVTSRDSRLVERCTAELGAVIPHLRELRLQRSAATRDADATFVPSPGLQRPGPQTAFPNVVIAGAWTDTGWPATMESAVRSGRLAAATLADAGAVQAQASETSRHAPSPFTGERVAV